MEKQISSDQMIFAARELWRDSPYATVLLEDFSSTSSHTSILPNQRQYKSKQPQQDNSYLNITDKKFKNDEEPSIMSEMEKLSVKNDVSFVDKENTAMQQNNKQDGEKNEMSSTIQENNTTQAKDKTEMYFSTQNPVQDKRVTCTYRHHHPVSIVVWKASLRQDWYIMSKLFCQADKTHKTQFTNFNSGSSPYALAVHPFSITGSTTEESTINHDDKAQSSNQDETQQDKQEPKDCWAVILFRSGHFAGAIFQNKVPMKKPSTHNITAQRVLDSNLRTASTQLDLYSVCQQYLHLQASNVCNHTDCFVSIPRSGDERVSETRTMISQQSNHNRPNLDQSNPSHTIPTQPNPSQSNYHESNPSQSSYHESSQSQSNYNESDQSPLSHSNSGRSTNKIQEYLLETCAPPPSANWSEGEWNQSGYTTILIHRAIHKYTSRRKQGGSQAAHDASGRKPKSMGAQIRRANEVLLATQIHETLASWQPLLARCSHIFIGATKRNRAILLGQDVSGQAPQSTLRQIYKQPQNNRNNIFDQLPEHISKAFPLAADRLSTHVSFPETAPFHQDDPRLCNVPFVVGRPTYEEVRSVYARLRRATIETLDAHMWEPVTSTEDLSTLSHVDSSTGILLETTTDSSTFLTHRFGSDDARNIFDTVNRFLGKYVDLVDASLLEQFGPEDISTENEKTYTSAQNDETHNSIEKEKTYTSTANEETQNSTEKEKTYASAEKEETQNSIEKEKTYTFIKSQISAQELLANLHEYDIISKLFVAVFALNSTLVHHITEYVQHEHSKTEQMSKLSTVSLELLAYTLLDGVRHASTLFVTHGTRSSEGDISISTTERIQRIMQEILTTIFHTLSEWNMLNTSSRHDTDDLYSTMKDSDWCTVLSAHTNEPLRRSKRGMSHSYAGIDAKLRNQFMYYMLSEIDHWLHHTSKRKLHNIISCSNATMHDATDHAQVTHDSSSNESDSDTSTETEFDSDTELSNTNERMVTEHTAIEPIVNKNPRKEVVFANKNRSAGTKKPKSRQDTTSIARPSSAQLDRNEIKNNGADDLEVDDTALDEAMHKAQKEREFLLQLAQLQDEIQILNRTLNDKKDQSFNHLLCLFRNTNTSTCVIPLSPNNDIEQILLTEWKTLLHRMVHCIIVRQWESEEEERTVESNDLKSQLQQQVNQLRTQISRCETLVALCENATDASANEALSEVFLCLGWETASMIASLNFELSDWIQFLDSMDRAKSFKTDVDQSNSTEKRTNTKKRNKKGKRSKKR